MIEDEKDAAAAVKLPGNVKDRLLTNERLYRSECNASKV